MINLSTPFLGPDGKTVSQAWATYLASLAQQTNVVVSFNGRGGTVRLGSSDVTQALGYTPANIDSAALTGTPTAPTADTGTNTKQIANCAFVLASVATIGAWKTPTLLNSWVDYGTPFSPTSYCVDTLGIVRLRGLVKSGTVGQSTPIFVLPTGFRPPSECIFPVVSNEALGRVDVDTDGNVFCLLGDNAFVSLDGINFRNA